MNDGALPPRSRYWAGALVMQTQLFSAHNAWDGAVCALGQ